LKVRDLSIDSLRGLAIFIMIIANSAPYIIPEPHHFLLRLVDSLAAPIFIFLVGFGISKQFLENPNSQNFKKNLKRGLLTILIAVL